MPKAKYHTIYMELKQGIEDGIFPYASLLPSEHLLIAQYDCSRNTVRRALARLSEEGYAQPIHGKGVRVLYQQAERAIFTVGGIESFQESAQRNQLNVITKVIAFSVITVDEKLAQKSGFAQGEVVYAIQRVRYIDGKPLILDVNYFLQSRLLSLTQSIAEQSIYAYLEQELGVQIGMSKRTITVERATAQDASVLDLGEYNCLAVVTGQTFDADGVMFEYTQSRHHPDYFSFHGTAVRRRDKPKADETTV